MTRLIARLGLLGILLSLATSLPAVELEDVATSTRQWTGIAVAPDGRIFVNFPRWSETVPVSVGELLADGTVVPYPDGRRQRWQRGDDGREVFVCVQSVHIDSAGRLWILDPANPRFRGVITGAPKLLQVDLATDTVVRTYRFDATVALPDSYLNDLRVDVATGTVFITDSGRGALVVLDLDSGVARRVLAGHPATQAEDIEVVIDGVPFTSTVHADGIALDAAGGWLYWQALTGHTLYRLPTAHLRDPARDDAALAAAIETVAESGVADGLLWTPEGVLVSGLEEGAIKRVSPDGTVSVLVADERIVWPDSFAQGPDGVYFTTAQIHLGPEPPTPYRVLRLR